MKLLPYEVQLLLLLTKQMTRPVSTFDISNLLCHCIDMIAPLLTHGCSIHGSDLCYTI